MIRFFSLVVRCSNTLKNMFLITFFVKKDHFTRSGRFQFFIFMLVKLFEIGYFSEMIQN